MNEWTYWCPHEGTHVSHPNELHVGIVNEKNEPLLIAAVVPAVMGDQMEPFAIAIVDALRAKSAEWTRPNHLADGLAAKGFPLGRLDWPWVTREGTVAADLVLVACPTCGAAKGERCRRQTIGKHSHVDDSHKARWEAFRDDTD